MTLSTDVQDRVPSAILVGLTNPRGGAAPTSIGSTLLTQACTSIEAWFGTYAQEAYDSSVPIHVEVAVKGVVALLKRWGAGEYALATEDWAAFKSECETVKNTRARARIEPATTSELTPSDEVVNGEVRPFADRTRWAGYLPRRATVDPDLHDE
jgi:hypothetical protein